MLRNLTSTSAADKINFSPIFFPSSYPFSFCPYCYGCKRTHRGTSSKNSSLLTIPCSTPAMFTNKRIFGLCGEEALNHGSKFKILWDTFRSQIAEFWFPYDRAIAIDRKRSQGIEHGSIFCDRRRSISITIAGSQSIAEVFPYNRRRSQNFLRSEIRDLRSSAIIWKLGFNKCLFVSLFRISRIYGIVTVFHACAQGKRMLKFVSQKLLPVVYNIELSVTRLNGCEMSPNLFTRIYCNQ